MTIPPEQLSTTNETYSTDRTSLEQDCDEEFFIASGPGGQHRNKVETGVRLTHRPTGTIVTATERRSQHANREAALERMARQLQKLQQIPKSRKATRPTTASQARRLEEKRLISKRKQQRSTSPDE